MNGPPAKGIWVLRGDDWARVQIVECSTQYPARRHASIDGRVSLCGRGVTFVLGATPQDTPSDVHCQTCRAALK